MFKKLLNGRSERRRRIKAQSAKHRNNLTARALAVATHEHYDCEAAVLPLRRMRKEGLHRAPPRDYCTDFRTRFFHFPQNSRTPEDGEEEDEHLLARAFKGPIARRQGRAKKAMMEAQTMKKLVDIAESLIEEDWMAQMEEFPGNIYRIAAFGKLFTVRKKYCFFDLSRIMGCVFIWLIQVVAPPILFMSGVSGWGIRQNYYHEEICIHHHWDYSDWKDKPTTKLLAILFIASFCLNGAFVITDEKNSWEKMDLTFRYLNQQTETFLRGEGFLVLDALTNCWTVLTCCLCTLVVIAPARSPGDVLFDALGLLFLYNLDDIGGDLGFLNADDWPGKRLAWIYSNMVPHKKHDGDPKSEGSKDDSEDEEEDEVDLDPRKDEPCLSKIGYHFVKFLYRLTVAVIVVFFFALPFYTAVTSFEPAESRAERTAAR